MKRSTACRVLCALLLACVVPAASPATAADWPAWRHDAARTAASPDDLPARLHLQWKRELPEPRPAFPEHVRLAYDMTYQPVVAGRTMLVPSMVTDSVTALDTRTGRRKWTFHAGGPVRLAPVIRKGRAYVACDDGFLYCLDLADGRVLWKVSGAPPERTKFRLLGNGRLICRWPARGGPVVADGTVYFGAGVWPSEGTCVCAVDAAGGELLWRNDNVSFIENGLIDHSARRPVGLSPQGYLAVFGDRLAVPSGRALPGFLDRESGEMEPYTTGWGGRAGLAKGSWWLCGAGDYYFHSGALFGLSADAASIDASDPPEWLSPGDLARALDVPEKTVRGWVEQGWLRTRRRDDRTEVHARSGGRVSYVGRASPREPGERHSVKAHPRLQIEPANRSELGVFREPVVTDDAIYYSRPVNNVRGRGAHWSSDLGYGDIVAFDTTDPKWGLSYSHGWGNTRRIIWKTLEFDRLWSLESDLKVHIKAGSRLYGAAPGRVAAIDLPAEGGKPRVSWRGEVEGTPRTMLAADDRLFVVTEHGTIYCFGGPEGQPRSYAQKEPERARRDDRWGRMAGRILEGTGVREGYCLALGVGSGRLVEELAARSDLHVVVLEPDGEKVARARRRFDELGLYGDRVHVIRGSLASLKLAPCWAGLVVSERSAEEVLSEEPGDGRDLLHVLRPYGGTAAFPREDGELDFMERSGALPGSADWTHESGNPGNTFSSLDDRVRPPFGVLWFGGSVDRIFPPWDFTHNRGPFPVICEGRMFALVANEVHAADIYTGRHLWKVTLEPSRKTDARLRPHMITQRNTAGNFVATPDGLYVIRQKTCLRLDPATGSRRGEIAIPSEVAGESAVWDEVRIVGDRLLGAVGRHLVCLDRRSGELLWHFEGRRDRLSFALGNGRAFCADYWGAARRRRGEEKADEAGIRALDVESGEVLWHKTAKTPADTADERTRSRFDPLAPYLTYCEPADTLLLTATRSIVAAYRGEDGSVLWGDGVPCRDVKSHWSGPEPPIVLPGVLITHAGERYVLQTGEKAGERLYNGMNRAYNSGGTRGCNRAVANRHVLTLRDAHAAYFDLHTGRETFFRGVRSGCTNNLLPAGGILNAPKFAHGCSCNWPVWTSLAFVHMPRAARWRSQAAARPTGR